MKNSLKLLISCQSWRAVMLSCAIGLISAPNASAVEFVFSRGAPIPELGIASYSGYSDVRLNNSFPNAGAGAEAIFVGDAGNAAINRGLIRWDLSSLANATILGDATLTMQVTQVSQDVSLEPVDGADFFDFHRIFDTNAGWVENGNANIAGGDATGVDPSWNNFSQTPLQPWVNAAGTGDFPGLGGLGDGYAMSPSFTLNQATYTTPEAVQITVPQAVIEEIIAGGANHPGFLVRARDEFFAGRIVFSGNATLHSLTIDADIPIQVAELEIDRATGAMTLMNNTEGAIDFRSYSITSTVGGLDTTEWTRVVDPNNWSDISATTGLLSEGEDPFINGLQLASGGTPISLGDTWIQSPFEDTQMELVLNDGSTQTVAVRYVGNGGVPYQLGDLNFDGDVTAADWPIYRNGFDQDFALLSVAQAYGMGDLNGDGVNDHADFVLFRTAFDANMGPGAFAAMISGVPEPGSIALMMLGSIIPLMYLRRKTNNENTRKGTTKKKSLIVIVGLAGTFLFPSSPASAAVFNLAYNINNRMLSGTTNSRDDNNGGNGGHIIGVNGGVDNFMLYGFDLSTFAGLTAIDNGSVAVLAAGVPTVPAAQHGSAADTISLHELYVTNAGWTTGPNPITGNDNRTNDGTASFLNFSQFDDDPGPPAGTSIPWRDEFGSNVSNLLGAIGPAIDTVAGFNSGETPDLFFDIPQATIQRWLNDGLAGLVLRTNDNGDGISRFRAIPDFLTIDVVGDQPTLEVNTTTGQVTMLNDSGVNFDMNFYEIISSAGALNPAQGAWNSFQDQDLEMNGPPTGTGNGWEELGTPHAGKVAEAYLQGSLLLETGMSETLGNVFDTSVFGTNMDGDLVFNIGLSDNSLLEGRVVYVTSAGLPGDFNGDGVVDAADYSLWRDNLGAGDESAFATGTGNGGGIDSSDYNLWRANFGQSFGSAANSLGSNTIPEPTAIAIAAPVLLGIGLGQCRRRSSRS